MTDDMPISESPGSTESHPAPLTSSTQTARRVKTGLLGAGVGCTATFLLLNTIRFIPYLSLALWVIICGALAFFKRGRTVLKMILTGVSITSALIAFSPIMDWSVDALDVSVAPQKADVIVILGAGLHCGTGDLDSASLARLTRGLALWKARYAPEITVSDADPSMVGGNCPSQGKVTTDFIDSLYGNDGPTTIVLPRMRTTRTEAAAVAVLARTNSWKRVLVVTSHTHSRRALDTFERAGVNAFVVGATEPEFDRHFSHPIDRVRALSPVVREVAGMIKYRLTR